MFGGALPTKVGSCVVEHWWSRCQLEGGEIRVAKLRVARLRVREFGKSLYVVMARPC